jgi:hypothetical protein
MSSSNSTINPFQVSINWNNLSQEAIVKKVTPFVDAKVCDFFGASEPEWVEHIIQAILPLKDDDKAKDPKDILEEICAAFGDSEEEIKEAEQLIQNCWKLIIWETEKIHVLGGKSLVAEKDLIDYEINDFL